MVTCSTVVISIYYSYIAIDIYYIVITIVQRDTRKYHEFIAEYCYECAARVTIPKAMNE